MDPLGEPGSLIVDSIMRHDVVTISTRATARDAARLMTERGIGSLIVADEGTPKGIVTERDLVKRVLSLGQDPDSTPVADIMSSPLATIEPAAQIEEAAVKMKKLGVKRLVVVLGDELRGIVTTTDLAYASPQVSKGLIEGWVKARWED